MGFEGPHDEHPPEVSRIDRTVEGYRLSLGFVVDRLKHRLEREILTSLLGYVPVSKVE